MVTLLCLFFQFHFNFASGNQVAWECELNLLEYLCAYHMFDHLLVFLILLLILVYA